MRHVANSELRVYQRCKRRWYLAFVRKLVPRQEGTGGVAWLGTRVHDALRVYYTETSDPLVTFKAAVGKDLEEHPDMEDELVKQMSLGLAMLEGYVEWVETEGMDQDLRIIGAESEITVEIMPGVMLIGKLDLQGQRVSDDARVWVDFKTVGSLTDQLPFLQTNPQMLTYGMIQELMKVSAERIDSAYYRMIKRVKRTARANPPFFKQHVIRHNKDQLRAFYWQTTGLIKGLVELERLLQNASPEMVHHLAPPSPTKDCTWSCPFAKVCLPALLDDAPARAEAALADLYVTGDPYARYTTLGGDE